MWKRKQLASLKFELDSWIPLSALISVTLPAYSSNQRNNAYLWLNHILCWEQQNLFLVTFCLLGSLYHLLAKWVQPSRLAAALYKFQQSTKLIKNCVMNDFLLHCVWCIGCSFDFVNNVWVSCGHYPFKIIMVKS